MTPTPCIVRFCKNKGTHCFPSDEARKAQWIQAIELKKPRLAIRKYSRICSEHFRPTDFNITPLFLLKSDVVPKTLKKTAIPSVFPWNSAPQEPPSISQDQDSPTFNLKKPLITYARTRPITFVEELDYVTTETSNLNEDPLILNIEDNNIDESSDKYDTGEVAIEEEKNINTPQERLLGNIETHEKCVQTQDNIIYGFSIHHYKNNGKAMEFYTGFENFNQIKLAFNTLEPYAQKLTNFYGQPPRELDALEQFFITLLILWRHTPCEEIAMLYQVTIKEICNIFVIWIRFMSLRWKNLDFCKYRDCFKVYIPSEVINRYPSIQIFLDAKTYTNKQEHLLLSQQVPFSLSKNGNTFRFLINISPSGWINDVCPCEGESATDKQIIKRSSILTKDFNDGVMVDTGLTVEDVVKKGDRTFKCHRKADNKRAHEERVIGMLKTYNILNEPMTQTEKMFSSNIVFICAMLVNIRSNIINQNDELTIHLADQPRRLSPV